MRIKYLYNKSTKGFISRVPILIFAIGGTIFHFRIPKKKGRILKK